MRNEEKFFLPSPRRGERGKKFSAFPTVWRTRKKIFCLPHGVANEEKIFSPSPRRGGRGKNFSPSPRCGERGKKFFAFPVLKLGNLQHKNPLFENLL